MVRVLISKRQCVPLSCNVAVLPTLFCLSLFGITKSVSGMCLHQCLKWFKKVAGSLARRHFPTGVGSGEVPRNFFLIFFHVKMMHFGVFCIQFHQPRARMNKISNVLESSIALAAVAGSPLGCFIVQSIDIWFDLCNRTHGEAAKKET